MKISPASVTGRISSANGMIPETISCCGVSCWSPRVRWLKGAETHGRLHPMMENILEYHWRKWFKNADDRIILNIYPTCNFRSQAGFLVYTGGYIPSDGSYHGATMVPPNQCHKPQQITEVRADDHHPRRCRQGIFHHPKRRGGSLGDGWR